MIVMRSSSREAIAIMIQAAGGQDIIEKLLFDDSERPFGFLVASSQLEAFKKAAESMEVPIPVV